MARTLTDAQHTALDEIADVDRDAIVVGWHSIVGGGPIVRCNNLLGRHYVNAAGNVKPLPASALRAAA